MRNNKDSVPDYLHIFIMIADRARREGGLRGGMFPNLDGGRDSRISSFSLSGVIN